VSTTGQNLDVQLEQLKKAGVSKVFKEKLSGANLERPELQNMLEYVREGDTVIITKIDRMARSTKHLLEITETLTCKGVFLKILNINLDTTTPTGKLMLTMIGAIAEFERDLLLERQREGIEKAKQKGVYKGRKPTARAKSDQIMQLASEGHTKQSIADQLGIGVASVYRVLKEHSKIS